MGMSDADYIVQGFSGLADGMSRQKADQRAQESHKMQMAMQRKQLGAMDQPLSDEENDMFEGRKLILQGIDPKTAAAMVKAKKQSKVGNLAEGVVPQSTFGNMAKSVGAPTAKAPTRRDFQSQDDTMQRTAPFFATNQRAEAAGERTRVADERIQLQREIAELNAGTREGIANADRQAAHQRLQARLDAMRDIAEMRGDSGELSALARMYSALLNSASRVEASGVTLADPKLGKTADEDRKRAEQMRTGAPASTTQRSGSVRTAPAKKVTVPPAPQSKTVPAKGAEQKVNDAVQSGIDGVKMPRTPDTVVTVIRKKDKKPKKMKWADAKKFDGNPDFEIQ
jgi:hypothetical protein